MRSILTAIFAFLLLCCQPSAAQEETQVSKEFTKTYRAYNAAYAQRNYARAAELARKVLDLALKELGPDHERFPSCRSTWPTSLSLSGKWRRPNPSCCRQKPR